MDLSQTIYIIAVPGQLDYLAVSFSKLIGRLCISLYSGDKTDRNETFTYIHFYLFSGRCLTV